MGIIGRILICVWLLWIAIALPPSTWAAPSPDRIPLTLELLQERLKSPIQQDGATALDLRRLVIDLRLENAEFRDQFYRLIQAQLQRSSTPLGLDFSYSLIRGELTVNDLGLRTSLYGQSLPIFDEAEQAQLQRDRRRLSQLSQLSRSLLIQSQPTSLQITVLRGTVTLMQTRFEGFVNFTNTFFLGRVDAQGATFIQDTDWSEARFGQSASFTNATFQREARFRSTIFFDRARYNQTQFQGSVNFQSSEFQATASFHQATFQQTANFSRVQWCNNADFAQTRWSEKAIFDRDNFTQSLFLTETTFEKIASFRQARFNQSVNLRGASILTQADFGDASFARSAYLNVPDLQFDPKKATILGDPRQIGRVLSVPTLQGNEALLRNLVQNFRLLQQISDANQIEYTTEKLRLRDLHQRLLGTDLNTATSGQLRKAGFSTAQINRIMEVRIQQPFRSLNDLLKLEEIDLATYVKVRDRVVAEAPLTPISWLLDGLNWIGLSTLLLLTRDGSSFWLVFGVGMVAIAHFGVLFWLVDRFRKWHPQAIVPTLEEILWLLGGFSLITTLGLAAIFRTAEHPWLTLACLGFVIIPIPVLLLGLIYWHGRYHDLMDVSYFVEDGSMRQLRFLIGRLPNIPLNPAFRERYTPILWERRWGWLNYFDFSLNNLLRVGFNDIRLRDEHMPGLITALVWYQWSIGILYFALLIWTLSRTIPGLNLLIYLK
ncbi:MAG: pentapeptide repeat-containing protein [Cyanobacteria bacterium CRU_2_1]|nr:pentapeptide repeat-containing protein [Cyanobacteria bacterium RU_5_0]NJR62657.1 pentapeptide repeat-containing protein [Cyanobacteria bacterium CRU_2_1]